MNKLKELKIAIYYNNFNTVNLLLKDKFFNQFDRLNEEIIEAAGQGYINIVELLLNDSRINITADQKNRAICCASFNGFYDIILLLLNEKNINPAYDNNYSNLYAHTNKYNDVVDLLWSYSKVKNTLQGDNIEVYNKLIKQDTKNKISKF